MTDHAWTLEHAAAFVANGLDAAETRRLEDHTRDCPDCAAAVADAVKFDRNMGALFAGVRPVLGLEDRAVTTLRTARRPFVVGGSFRRVAMAATILVALGAVGAFTASMVTGGRLRLPGETAEAHREREAAAQVRKENLENEDIGLDASITSALPETGRVDKQTVNAAVTSDPVGVPSATLDDSNSLKPPGVVIEDEVRHKANSSAGRGTESRGYGVSVPGRVPPANGVYGNSPKFNPVSGGYQGGMGGGLSGFGGGGLGGGIGGGMGGMPSASYAYFNPTTYKATLNQPPADGKANIFDLTAKTENKAQGQGKPNSSNGDPDKGRQDGQGEAKPNAKPAPITEDAPPKAEPARRIVIRSGDMEFEVESFDSALATVTKLVTGLQGAFVATVNSEKLPNGKVKGSVTVRTPPEHLDTLVLDLRRELGKGGELKGVRVGSQDITKQYTDLESRLKAARTMEQRLLQIIKEGKGEIKQLLEAERELGVWRTKIEETEGELRYYANQAALSTLTITVSEKEIRTAAGLSENERVQAGVEVEDVDKAYQTLLATVLEAKGRVTKSELKQLSAGQFNASLQFEVPPESGGPLRDRLRMLGRVARLEIDRVQQADGGPVPKDAKVKRGDTVFLVQIYNLANVAPRETTTVQVAVPDVAAAYQAVREAATKVLGKVLTAQLNENDPKNVTAQLDFEVKRTDDPAIRAALDTAGEVVSRQVGRAAEGDAVTDTKILYRTSFIAAASLKPRETTVLSLDVPDVDQTATVFSAQVAEVKGRTVVSTTARDKHGKAAARLVYEVPLSAAAGVVEKFKAAGTVRVIESARDPRTPDTKFATARIDVTLGVPEPIVANNDGLWPPVRKGLSYSASVLLTSLTWVVFGLCVVLPWGVVGYGVYRLVRRKKATT